MNFSLRLLSMVITLLTLVFWLSWALNLIILILLLNLKFKLNVKEI